MVMPEHIQWLGILGLLVAAFAIPAAALLRANFFR